jgi:hypothetical protein
LPWVSEDFLLGLLNSVGTVKTLGLLEMDWTYVALWGNHESFGIRGWILCFELWTVPHRHLLNVWSLASSVIFEVSRKFWRLGLLGGKSHRDRGQLWRSPCPESLSLFLAVWFLATMRWNIPHHMMFCPGAGGQSTMNWTLCNYATK